MSTTFVGSILFIVFCLSNLPCTNLIIESSNLSKLDKKFSDKLKTFCFVKTVSAVKLSLTFAKDFAILALFFSH